MRRHLWRFGLTTLLLLSLVLSVPQPLTAQAVSMAEILSQIEKIPTTRTCWGRGRHAHASRSSRPRSCARSLKV